MVAAKRVLDWQQRLEEIADEIEAEADDCPDMEVRVALDGVRSQLTDIGLSLDDCSGQY